MGPKQALRHYCDCKYYLLVIWNCGYILLSIRLQSQSQQAEPQKAYTQVNEVFLQISVVNPTAM